METLLAGPGADAKVTGAYAPHARQHVDFDTTQEHGAPNTTSDLAFRGILADRSSAVWRGMIKVDPGAQQTDAFQVCRNLLLSKKAHADAIPGLEILANDVRCTHAAAVAQIDKEQLFYLRSRGLDKASATRLVIEGFMAELVERFEEGPMREALATALERRLTPSWTDAPGRRRCRRQPIRPHPARTPARRRRASHAAIRSSPLRNARMWAGGAARPASIRLPTYSTNMCSIESGRADGMPIERLEREITQLASHIHAATCRWLGLVADSTGGAAGPPGHAAAAPTGSPGAAR